jgi:hypothetical protein
MLAAETSVGGFGGYVAMERVFDAASSRRRAGSAITSTSAISVEATEVPDAATAERLGQFRVWTIFDSMDSQGHSKACAAAVLRTTQMWSSG